MANSKFFTNTYTTGSGRQNFLRADYLEDPLFTSFTFDIDFISSPLFYTINNYIYPHPNKIGLSEQIQTALGEMRKKMFPDQGYDILPLYSGEFLNGDKLGFGLQQNVYMDLPLYGATEYIYMVDKRNGDGSQNDVRYDNSGSADSGGFKSYKLGDSLKEAVSKSDSEWANKKIDQANEQIKRCDEILNNKEEQNNHKINEDDMNAKKSACEIKATVDGVKDENGNVKEFTEEDLEKEIKNLKKLANEFDLFKKEIVNWVNSKLSQYQSRATAVYTGNSCVVEIFAKDGLPNKSIDERNAYAVYLANKYGSDFRDKYLYFGEENGREVGFLGKMLNISSETAVLLEEKNGIFVVRQREILNQFREKMEYFKLCEKNATNFKGNIRVSQIKEVPDWANSDKAKYLHVFNGDIIAKINVYYAQIEKLMSYGCDMELAFDNEFMSEEIANNDNILAKYEDALDNMRCQLYGTDENGNPCDKYNPTPESSYGQYLEAKDKCENDAFSQAKKTQSIAKSEIDNMESMLDNEQNATDEPSEEIPTTNIQQTEKKPEPIITPQTVLDMLGFISGMRKMTTEYPYIIQGITGLDKAYESHYGVKDPYMGSGDNKIVLTCWESLDLRVTSMFNRYFNAVYDRQYRRERVPINLRRFNCSVYVHDVRNFVSKNSDSKYANKMLELTDMYFSAIEFKFYDCEIVPEETGNIFNDISNEAPTEMKKTNFTFTYGNCVVNFVPQSEVAKYR